MPWPAVPMTSPVIQQLNSCVALAGIPTLLVLRADGSVVCTDATERIVAEPDAFPWERKALEVLCALTLL